jgi:hypothetical protein
MAIATAPTLQDLQSKADALANRAMEVFERKMLLTNQKTGKTDATVVERLIAERDLPAVENEWLTVSVELEQVKTEMEAMRNRNKAELSADLKAKTRAALEKELPLVLAARKAALVTQKVQFEGAQALQTNYDPLCFMPLANEQFFESWVRMLRLYGFGDLLDKHGL